MAEIPKNIKRLFWDVDKDKVEVKAHRFYLIKRIMDYGNLADVQWMKEMYTSQEIIEVLKKARGLSRKSAYFWAAYYHVSREEMSCLKEP